VLVCECVRNQCVLSVATCAPVYYSPSKSPQARHVLNFFYSVSAVCCTARPLICRSSRKSHVKTHAALV